MIRIVYKIKPHKPTGAQCTDCGRHCPNPVWIGFMYDDDDVNVLDAPYGSCCAKKYKVGELIDETDRPA